jgi:CelD/BcsL family acetyltransferase involved in cellulose biosynthesis
MMTSTPWDTFPSDLQPIAGGIGPFASRSFLEVVWNHRDTAGLDLQVETVSDGAVALVTDGDRIEFAGQSNLTDYHSPLGAAGGEALAQALESHQGASVYLDSLPLEAVATVEEAIRNVGGAPSSSQHETTAVLDLPASYDDWLASIGKKERHEVRRKRRRFVAEFGEIDIVPHGSEAINMFGAMHRTSQGAKGMFMTGEMQSYFEELLDTGGATIHTLVCDGIPRANAFGFETDDGYFYYNSAYDMDAAMASPGIVLLASMVEAQIERGARVFDFLKGDERYKFKHGARPRPLYAVSGQLP